MKRLHGSPIDDRSFYEEARRDTCAARIRAMLGDGRETWCMFDNIPSSFATADAAAPVERP